MTDLLTTTLVIIIVPKLETEFVCHSRSNMSTSSISMTFCYDDVFIDDSLTIRGAAAFACGLISFQDNLKLA